MATPDILVYDRLWEVLLEQSAVADNVRAENRINLTEWNASKREVSWADFPVLIIKDAGNESTLSLNSSEDGYTRIYQIGLLTGGDKVDDQFYDVQFGIMRGLIEFTRTYRQLQFDGRSFVGDAEYAEPSDIELSDDFIDSYDGGQLAWATTINFNVLMYFPKG